MSGAGAYSDPFTSARCAVVVAGYQPTARQTSRSGYTAIALRTAVTAQAVVESYGDHSFRGYGNTPRNMAVGFEFGAMWRVVTIHAAGVVQWWDHCSSRGIILVNTGAKHLTHETQRYYLISAIRRASWTERLD
ncbi:MAG TPA: hypothetical protein VGS41_02125 [Chthonomonadales bacterium]|nr:hypothetical protein [Chthonomonadales bacterium]